MTHGSGSPTATCAHITQFTAQDYDLTRYKQLILVLLSEKQLKAGDFPLWRRNRHKVHLEQQRWKRIGLKSYLNERRSYQLRTPHARGARGLTSFTHPNGNATRDARSVTPTSIHASLHAGRARRERALNLGVSRLSRARRKSRDFRCAGFTLR